MKIALGSDKSGFFLKEAIKKHLIEKQIAFEDVGTLDFDAPKPFFEVAPIAAQRIAAGEFDRGILICGTGMGMSIVANKFAGVFAACAESVYAAEKCRAINDANVLTMGGWVIGEVMGIDMVDKFLNTEFTESLEPWRQEFLKKAIVQVKSIDEAQRAKLG